MSKIGTGWLEHTLGQVPVDWRCARQRLDAGNRAGN